MHICSIVGARPQFVKAAVVSHALVDAGIRESLIHTGQHYDGDMSDVFFDELGIPAPERNLGIGSGSHADQTGRMMVALEQAFDDLQPDRILVYGDTNSTLAAALVAAKLHIPLDHVEAGLRSFNRRMPEEINRIVTDRLSDLLFCPTATAVAHLAAEGRTEGVRMTGDVMLDATLHFSERAAERHPLSSLTDVPAKAYSVATIHRAENTDHPERLQAIVRALGNLDEPVLLPLHPRTRGRLSDMHVPSSIRLLPPVPYLSMLTLVRNARRAFTDSGGLQKEAVWLGTPCITLRDETEWTETTAGGWNRVVGADERAILEAARTEPSSTAPVFGTGDFGDRASQAIAGLILQTQT
jgi:UDP-N-acetylglucosamine 2-epimerase